MRPVLRPLGTPRVLRALARLVAAGAAVPAALACGPPPGLWDYVRARHLVAAAEVLAVERPAPAAAPDRADADRAEARPLPPPRVTVRLLEVWSGDAALAGREISFVRREPPAGTVLVIAAPFEGRWYAADLRPLADDDERRALRRLVRRGVELAGPPAAAADEAAEPDAPDPRAILDWLVDACDVAPVRELALRGIVYQYDAATGRVLSDLLLFSHQQRLANVLADGGPLGGEELRHLVALLDGYPGAFVDRAAVRAVDAVLARPDQAAFAGPTVARVLDRLGAPEFAGRARRVVPRRAGEAWQDYAARGAAALRNTWDAARSALAPAYPYAWGP